MQDIFIRIVYDLPYTVGAYTAMDAEGNANVYVNGNWPDDGQHDAVLHELIHISADHWSGSCVEDMERSARNYDLLLRRSFK